MVKSRYETVLWFVYVHPIPYSLFVLQQNLKNHVVVPPPLLPKPEMPKVQEEGAFVFHFISFFFYVYLQYVSRTLNFMGLAVCLSVEENPEKKQEEKERRRKEYVRTYVSPWERAMKGDEILVATMKGCMPGPIQIQPDMPQYKSFNR